jgi:hypothetical protein
MNLKLFLQFLMLLFVFAACKERPVEKSINEINYEKKLDSLSKENSIIKKKLSFINDSLNNEPFNKKIKLYTLKGKFTEAFLGDCFHLSFKDENNKLWNFDNPDNIYGMRLLDTKDDLKLKKGITKKKFLLTYANLKGIDCQSAESYYEDEKKYTVLPTIIHLEEIKK